MNAMPMHMPVEVPYDLARDLVIGLKNETFRRTLFEKLDLQKFSEFVVPLADTTMMYHIATSLSEPSTTVGSSTTTARWRPTTTGLTLTSGTTRRIWR